MKRIIIIGFIAIFAVNALIWSYWSDIEIMFESEPPFQTYEVELHYCDSRPPEIRKFTVDSGLPPEILTYREAVPVLCFCGRGVGSTRVLNVCDFKILSVQYLK